MPASGGQVLWWVGLGTAAAAAVTGGVLVYRARKRAKEPEYPFPPEAAPGPMPPVPPPVPVPPVPELGFRAPPSDLRQEICRQWKVGQNRPRWRAELFEVIGAAIEDQIAARQPEWSTIHQFNRQVFYVARAALMEICPEIPVPKSLAGVDKMKEQEGFYWRELWDIFTSTATTKLSA